MIGRSTKSSVPRYLAETYWWAYLHEDSPTVFDHPAVVNTILWGQYDKLVERTLKHTSDARKLLQASCAYGNVSPKLARQVQQNKGHFDMVDVSPTQLAVAQRKLAHLDNVRMLQHDVTQDWRHACEAGLSEAGSYDACVLFFLLHELPRAQKTQALEQMLQTVRPDGGKLICVDFHPPHWWHPLRPVEAAVFHTLEPFANDLWQHPMASFLPHHIDPN
ncbi:MAG: hypothetical protein MHM6MM_007933, partial [Cercozoa sp. M6MM]